MESTFNNIGAILIKLGKPCHRSETIPITKYKAIINDPNQ